MPIGFQCFDASGNIILDATYRVLRVISAVQLSNGVSSSLTDGRLAQGGWVSFQPSINAGDGYLSGGVITPRFSISGSVLSWSYIPKRNSQYDIFQDGILFYGAS